MDDVIKQLMDEVARSYAENLRLTDELLSALYFVFQAPLQSALDLIDRENIILLKSSTGRSLFQIVGSSGHLYSCYRGINYCGCLAYRFSVLKKSEVVMCKHVLAVRLSEAMKTFREHSVTDDEISNLLKAMD